MRWYIVWILHRIHSSICFSVMKCHEEGHAVLHKGEFCPGGFVSICIVFLLTKSDFVLYL